MTTDPTTEPITNAEARAHMSAGYVKADEEHAEARLRQTAAQYRPENDEEADRLRALADRGIPISPNVRMQIGMHLRQRKAAQMINNTEGDPSS